MGSLPLNGLRLIETPSLLHQYRVPRTKKRRIRRKWALRAENYSPYRGVLRDNLSDVFYCHPMIAAKLRAQLASQ